MSSLPHRTAAAAGAFAAVALLVTAPPAGTAGIRDLTADVLADRDVPLTGDPVVTVPSRGVDGIDATLTTAATTPATTASPSPTLATRTAADATPTDTRTASATSDAFGWWPYVLGLGLLGGLMVPPTRGTQGHGGRRGGGRHAG
ncbi:hypothetical protein [Streptomyces blattellae]|uniref:hypothetical protein n=1 Tax=Streptomyces blattellae TaxID=2569855 RepID=UPI0012B72728|nr:hypothetical protein [Streptomyces blattellae]